MPPRTLSLTDARRRDAEVEAVPVEGDARLHWINTRTGASLHLERLVKQTDKTDYGALLQGAGGDARRLAESLVASDPEIPLEHVGRRLGRASRVWTSSSGEVLYAARMLEVVRDPDGEERSRRDYVDVEATVAESQPPLPWSGRLIPVVEAVRKFAFVRKLQLRHVNGLTFDFLFEIAQALSREGKLLHVGAGPKGQLPLIFQTNGSPFRGFLEGRVEGDSFLLLLHLTNLELKLPRSAAEVPPSEPNP